MPAVREIRRLGKEASQKINSYRAQKEHMKSITTILLLSTKTRLLP